MCVHLTQRGFERQKPWGLVPWKVSHNCRAPIKVSATNNESSVKFSARPPVLVLMLTFLRSHCNSSYIHIQPASHGPRCWCIFSQFHQYFHSFHLSRSPATTQVQIPNTINIERCQLCQVWTFHLAANHQPLVWCIITPQGHSTQCCFYWCEGDIKQKHRVRFGAFAMMFKINLKT